MTDLFVFPDAAQVTIDYLDSVLAEPVLPRPPDPLVDAFVTVLRTGGPRRDLVTDNALLAIEGWGATDAAALELAERARAWLRQMPGRRSDTTVYRVRETLGPQNLPDPVSAQPRCIFTVQVAMRGSTVPA